MEEEAAPYPAHPGSRVLERKQGLGPEVALGQVPARGR